MNPVVYNLETMLTDVRYARRQLKLIDSAETIYSDEVDRALDALERVEERLLNTLAEEKTGRARE